jgi:hypothetical protein
MKPYNKLRHVTKSLLEEAVRADELSLKPDSLYKNIMKTLEVSNSKVTAKIFGVSESLIYLIQEDNKSRVHVFEFN